jgi:hypothetical protein
MSAEKKRKSITFDFFEKFLNLLIGLHAFVKDLSNLKLILKLSKN